MTEIYRGETHILVVDLDDEEWSNEAGGVVNVKPKGFLVGLPHSCDQWDLAGSFYDHLDGTGSCVTMDKHTAIARLEAMINECQGAILAIKECDDNGPDAPEAD